MIKGFRDFLLRGSVIDLAVAVVIGAAFTALIKAFTDAFITPLVNVALGAGNVPEGLVIQLTDSQAINISLMINAIIIFILTAAVVYFIFVVPVNKARARIDKGEADEEEEDALGVLKDIRKALAEREGGGGA